MIRRLRARHRAAAVLWILVLPPFVALALTARPAPPLAEEVPPVLRAGARPGPGAPRALEIGIVRSDGELRLVVPEAWDVPDSLVYLVDGAPEPGADLPPDARFVAAVRPGDALALPPDAERLTVVVYGLARGEIAFVAPAGEPAEERGR